MNLYGLLVVALFAAIPGKSFANPIVGQKVLTSGYRFCKWVDRGTDSTITLVFNYAAATGTAIGQTKFLSRAVMIYGYDKNGVVSRNFKAESVTMRSTGSRGSIELADGSTMYHGIGSGSNSWWTVTAATAAEIEIVVRNSDLGGWPGITVRAANYTDTYVVAEDSGGVFIQKGDDATGQCTLIDPVDPPSPDIAINMTAPDWNLSVLPLGEGRKTFTNPTEQLCFTYTSSQVSGKSFVINAVNVNGIANNRYRLKNVSDSSQLVPYSVTLDSGTSKLTLPNTGSSALSLSSSGRTCFVPTFETFADEKVKEGDYGDVLQFNVVTKP
ncbi:hypothetical protein [Burkholderia diffusa]|uniref:hypothetical protein n=1 Tax=Burkholderia diffusa TaxID=488732 RepID=UPI0012DA184F|nr:hypothetical protein [Burkholderia diffusa]